MDREAEQAVAAAERRQGTIDGIISLVDLGIEAVKSLAPTGELTPLQMARAEVEAAAKLLTEDPGSDGHLANHISARKRLHILEEAYKDVTRSR